MPMERGREVAKLYQYKEALPQDLSPIQFRLPFFLAGKAFLLYTCIASSLKPLL